MPSDNSNAGSPSDWIRHAKSDLVLASVKPPDNVLLETLCYHAQQAAEKALKAALVHLKIYFPKTHNLRTLLDLIPDEVGTTDYLQQAAILTDYAVTTRYPTDTEPVEEEEYRQAIDLAKKVIDWAMKSWRGVRASRSM